MIIDIICLYLALSFIMAGYTYLSSQRDDVNIYSHAFRWFVSPAVLIAGIVFIRRARRKGYFARLRKNLFFK